MVGMRNSNVYHGFHCLYLVLVSFLVIFFLVFCLLLRSCGMKLTSRSIRLLLLSSGLLGGLSDFSGTGFFLGDGLDDSDGHRLPHIADGEATKRGLVDKRDFSDYYFEFYKYVCVVIDLRNMSAAATT